MITYLVDLCELRHLCVTGQLGSHFPFSGKDPLLQPCMRAFGVLAGTLLAVIYKTTP